MPRVPVQLGPTSDSSKSLQGGGSRLTNCYVERTDGGKTPYTINTDPGTIDFSTVSATGAIRGMVALGNSLYVVSGEAAYRVDSGGAATNIGTVLGQKPVLFSINRKAPNRQIVVTTETNNFTIEGGAMAAIGDPDLPSGVHSTAYFNGYTVFGIDDGSAYVSDKDEATSIGGLAFFEAERSADNGVRLFTNGEELWYFGTESLEIFRDSGIGLAPQPFTPIQGAGQGKGAGCLGKHSVAFLDSSPFWISDLRIVVRANGYAPVRVSNHEVERDIEAAYEAGITDQIVAFAFENEGHQFYYLRCSLWTWVYDAATNTWHDKKSHLLQTWKNGFYAYAFSKHLVGDATAGKVYQYSRAAHDEAGDPLITQIKSALVAGYPNGMICSAFHLDLQAGVGRAAEAAHIQNPMALLRVSGDGGITFGNEYSRNMGAQGQWNNQLRFNRLGKATGAGMQFEISLPEPVERGVFQAFADIDALKV